MPNIAEVIQQLSPGELVEMFELDLTPATGTALPSDHLYFHSGTNKLNQSLVWQAKTYSPFPVEAMGFEVTTKGSIPRPRLKVANVSGAISALLLQYDDLVGARVIRRRTFGRYLDAVNFPGGVNANADPTQYLPDQVFIVERKVSENKSMVEWELASVIDLEGVMLPNRIINGSTCSWRYRSPECSYAGTSYFNVTDSPVGSLALDVCSKKVSGCKVRFGATAILPFGGFPAARTYRY